MKIGPTLKPKVGTSLKFKGKVVPAKAGVTVQRQMKVDGVWQVKATTITKKSGQFSFTIKKAVPAGAKYEYRVIVVNNGVEGVASASGLVRIRK